MEKFKDLESTLKEFRTTLEEFLKQKRELYEITYGFFMADRSNYLLQSKSVTIDGLSFGAAIEALKHGKKVTRKGWNGKGMYLKLIQGYPVNGHLNPSSNNFKVPEITPDGSENITQGLPGQMLDFIVMKTAGDSKYWGEGHSDYVHWLASQTDMLAEDWVILE
jgi:hypothetical protein